MFKTDMDMRIIREGFLEGETIRKILKAWVNIYGFHKHQLH